MLNNFSVMTKVAVTDMKRAKEFYQDKWDKKKRSIPLL